MEYFIFNGIDSRNYDIVIKEMPLVSRAERNIESIEVDGRNGALHSDKGNFKSRSYSIACIGLDKAKTLDFVAKLYGTGTLSLSKYPNRTFSATIKNQVDFSTYANYCYEFPAQFELDPISYGTEKTKLGAGTVTLEGNTDAYLIIETTGATTVTINGVQVTTTEAVSIDCNLKTCYKNGIAKNDKVELVEFPTLHAGTNTLSGTKFSVKYKEGWL